LRLRFKINEEYERKYRHCFRETIFGTKCQNYVVKLHQVLAGQYQDDVFCSLRDDEKRKCYYLPASYFGKIIERLYKL